MAVDKSAELSLPHHKSASSHDESPQRSETTDKQSDETTSDFEGDHLEEPAVQVPADMQMFIGRQLRAVFDDVAKQPIPDRFLELMRQLEGKPAGL